MLLSSNMEKETLCKNILKELNKSDVGVKVSQDIKGNYYSYINNCIYLSNAKVDNMESTVKDIVVIAHECIHASQNKIWHILNVVFANIELLLFVIYIIGYFIFENMITFKIVYILTCILSLILRLKLEFPAMIKSFSLAQKYCTVEACKIIQRYEKKMKYMLPIGILSFCWLKIIRLIVIIII